MSFNSFTDRNSRTTTAESRQLHSEGYGNDAHDATNQSLCLKQLRHRLHHCKRPNRNCIAATLLQDRQNESADEQR